MPDEIPVELGKALEGLPLAGIRYFNSIGSTNDHCLRWEMEGAKDFSLVVADYQSAGRGRAGRKWVTNPGSALAFSLLLRPADRDTRHLTCYSPLGALAITEALRCLHGIQAEVKWPNDVLVRRRKLAGILVENSWNGQNLRAIVIGIGVNVSSKAVPPAQESMFPVTCVESETGSPVDRWRLLAEVVKGIAAGRERLGQTAFFEEWSRYLAFKGEQVCVSGTLREDLVGRLVGVDFEGNLMIETAAGKQVAVSIGDVRLRAV
jgi:BirA family biotin operon repressor/biotin-[acetyl-CoA-carboxylase] ligase